jgi:hypothetical protein
VCAPGKKCRVDFIQSNVQARGFCIPFLRGLHEVVNVVEVTANRLKLPGFRGTELNDLTILKQCLPDTSDLILQTHFGKTSNLSGD